MIRVADVTQHYGVRPVLRGVSMQIAAGELVALLGPNGMGKSTLLRVIAGVLQPQQGYVEINGLRRRSSPENELAIRRQLVYLPDHPWLPRNRTGREFLLGVGRLYQSDQQRLMDHIDRLLEVFELRRQGDWPIRGYSNGQQKKIALCSALVTEAPILVFDEPFSGGLDPGGILALKRIMQRLAERNDRTIVMATPVPEIVETLAHRVAIIRDGQLAAFDTVDELKQQTEPGGHLADVLGRLVHPRTLENIDHYFEDTPP